MGGVMKYELGVVSQGFLHRQNYNRFVGGWEGTGFLIKFERTQG